ncbi:MAG: DUF1847 domain-containing protein [Candidatus Nezhaarchaeota archaeon]|nr:DUF1847 domain-containing protein [Candidatus Nezhaarchaeota archaeon]
MLCAKCNVMACVRGGEPPINCPMKDMPTIVTEATRLYFDEKERAIAKIAAEVEKDGYAFWPRIREFAEFSKRLGANRVGIAFCLGLKDVARQIVEYLEEMDFQVFSVACKCGGIDKSQVLGEGAKMKREAFEPMCNPIAQALILNSLRTEVNGVVGLCVGHDSLFYMHSKAPTVTMVVKDRVTGHNPVAALYAKNYFAQRLYGSKPS